MSRTQRRGGSKSPIQRYLKFSGNTGLFSYFDKTKGEKGEDVELEELSLIVLDVRASITGFNSSANTGISSNMVTNIGNDPLTVQSFKDGKKIFIAEGLYSEIKGTVKSAGGKFTTNVIALADIGDGNGEQVVCLQLTGSALNGWIEFVNSLDQDGEYDNHITITKGALSKNGKDGFVPVTAKEEKELMAKLKKNPRAKQPIWFYVLAFSTEELTEEQTERAVAQDEGLQKYFGASKPASETTDSADQDAPEDAEADDKDDLPF